MNKILPNIKNILLVASGKGGVGKSTVASNLAVALSRNGCAVGLLDADLYGPSIPLTFGIEDQRPVIKNDGDKEKFEPLVNHGVKVMSLGFLMKKADAVIWRGPMASNALSQLIFDTEWGELDYLILDLPPGTGDIAITIAQKLPESKALIVITPQQMAVSDGRKAASMFGTNGISIEVLGIVENMSWFSPAKHPDEKYMLFGQGGGVQLAQELAVPLLAQIPLISDVCELCDAGKTIFASSEGLIVSAFEELADKITRKNTVGA